MESFSDLQLCFVTQPRNTNRMFFEHHRQYTKPTAGQLAKFNHIMYQYRQTCSIDTTHTVSTCFRHFHLTLEILIKKLRNP